MAVDANKIELQGVKSKFWNFKVWNPNTPKLYRYSFQFSFLIFCNHVHIYIYILYGMIKTWTCNYRLGFQICFLNAHMNSLLSMTYLECCIMLLYLHDRNPWPLIPRRLTSVERKECLFPSHICNVTSKLISMVLVHAYLCNFTFFFKKNVTRNQRNFFFF